MENILLFFLGALSIVLLKIILKINYKRAKELEENKELQKITDRFPSNLEIANEMLCILENETVKVEEVKDTKTSLYIAISNKIVIADMKDNYARIQTIAHECLHSVQDRTLLMFNFIFSNITIIYWSVAIILTICNVFKNTLLQAFILLLLCFIQTIIRVFLEVDAMMKSKYLAKEYIEMKNLCTKEEKQELLKEYEKINKIGIPFYMFEIVKSSFVKIIILILVSFI